MMTGLALCGVMHMVVLSCSSHNRGAGSPSPCRGPLSNSVHMVYLEIITSREEKTYLGLVTSLGVIVFRMCIFLIMIIHHECNVNVVGTGSRFIQDSKCY